MPRTLLSLLTDNWALKLAALLLAILLWTIVKSGELSRVRLDDIPIEVVVQDPGWTLAAPPAPSTASVVFSGPWRELVRLGVNQPRVIVVVDEVRDSMELRSLSTSWVQLEGDLQRTRTEEIQPSSVLLAFERLRTRLVPVSVPTTGTLPEGLELAGPLRVDPPAIRVSGAGERLVGLDSIRIQPIDLSQIRYSAALTLPVDSSALAGLAFSPRSVEVYVPVTMTDTLPPTAPLTTEGSR